MNSLVMVKADLRIVVEKELINEIKSVWTGLTSDGGESID